jgi:hypothetical protein
VIRIAVVLSIVMFAGIASADDVPPERRRLVGILDVQASPEIAASFEQALEDQLDSKMYWLVPRAKMRERLRNSTKWSEGCFVGPCMTEVKVQTSAELVVLAALTGSGTSFGYVVTVVRTDTGRVLAQESERCEVCTINEAMSAATLATIRLVTAVPDELPADTPITSPARASTRNTRKVGIAMTLVGLAAAGVGTALYFAQDEPDYALATMAAGGGLALGGVLVLTF